MITEYSFDATVNQRCCIALTQYFRDTSTNGNKTGYFVTVSYADSVQYPLSAASANLQFKTFHRCLLEHLAQSKNIHRPWFRKIEPIVYAFLDVPGSKIKTSKAQSAGTRLSTYHHHCIVLVDETHVQNFEALTDPTNVNDFIYECRDRCRVRTINIERINSTDDDLAKCVSYAAKHYFRDRDDLNRLQIYPISTKELAN